MTLREMRRKLLNAVCLFILLPSAMQAQDLAPLAVSEDIRVSTLPNGITCYIVTGKEKKGFADYALIQKGQSDAETAAGVLSSLPHLGGRSPRAFVSSHGCAPGDGGYVTFLPSSTRYDFPCMPVYDQTVVDTTIMMIFDIAANFPGEQAVIVSGDVSAQSLLEKMKTFSILVDRRVPHADSSFHSRNSSDTLRSLVMRTASDNVASLNIFIRTPRPDRSEMNTVLPLVTGMYSRELVLILRERLARVLEEKGIPVLEVRGTYEDSASGPYDELLRLKLSVPVSRIADASRLSAGVLAGIDSSGVGIPEFRYAKARILEEEAFRCRENSTDREYVDQCAAAWLYGGNLASRATVSAFLSRKGLPEERELSIFNAYISSLIDVSHNVTLRFDLPAGIPAEGLEDEFRQGLDEKLDGWFKAGDTLSPIVQSKSKIKIKSTTREPVSGGSVWTFSNGMTVVYKKSAGIGRFDYALMLRGGYAGITGLGNGDGPLVSEIFPLSTMAGMPWTEFNAMLNTAGISMRATVSASDMDIRGSVLSSAKELFYSALSAVVNTRRPDSNAFAAFSERTKYRKSLEQLYPRNTGRILDSLSCPDYEYPGQRKMPLSCVDLQSLAEEYYAHQFTKCGDGVLVLMGDLDEETLKKDLCRVLAAFPSRKTFSPRPIVSCPVRSGRISLFSESAEGVVGGAETGLYIQNEVRTDISLASDISFDIASRILRIKLAALLAEDGCTGEVSVVKKTFPYEGMGIRVSVHPCSPGSPYQIPAQKVQEDVRSLLENLADTVPDKETVKVLKTNLKSEMKELGNRPWALIDRILVRYSLGRDTYSGYEAAVDAVTPESVRKLFSSLVDSWNIEYVIG